MEQKKKKKKILFWVLIGGIIVGIVSLGIIFHFSKSELSAQKESESKKPTSEDPSLPEESDNCPYNEESLKTFSKSYYEQASEENLVEWRRIPRNFIIELWKKGYHWHDIIQLWGWKLSPEEIPDLSSQKRVGVINGLIYMPNPQLSEPNITTEEKLRIAETNHWVGRTRDLIIIVQKTPSGGPKINIDKRFDQGVENERGDRGQVRKIIKLALQQENINPQQCEVSVLWAIGVQKFGNEWDVNCGHSRGGSGGSAIYLALLSALRQKPISCQVAATGTLETSKSKGTINGQEINLEPGTNLPINGLKEKITACVEKGVNKLVLSKYQSSPNLLTKKDKNNPNKELKFEDFQQVILPEIKAKIQVYWTENIQDLRDLVLQGKLS